MKNGRNLIRENGRGKALARRDWLKAAGLALLSAPALGAADDLRAKAKKNLKLAVHTAPYAGVARGGRSPTDQGRGLQRGPHRLRLCRRPLRPAGARLEGRREDRRQLRAARRADRGGLRLRQRRGPGSRETQARRDADGNAHQELEAAGLPNVSTETGTFNPKSDWVDSPENATEQGYLQCRSALEKLARMAEKAGAVVSIEPYWRNVIDSIDRTERLFREVNSPALKLVMDPCNYFRKEDLPRMKPMLEDMFRRLGDPDRAGPRQGREGVGRRDGSAGVRAGRARLSALSAAAWPGSTGRWTW